MAKAKPPDRDRVKETLTERLADPDYNTANALERLRTQGYLPIRDPRDGLLITHVETDRVPGTGTFVKQMTKIVERECPECGYDRAEKMNWAVYTCESGHHVTCRACDHVIEERSSL